MKSHYVIASLSLIGKLRFIIMGYGIGVVNNCYTSQLNVTIRESFNNKTVQCILNSNEGTIIIQIGESVLNVLCHCWSSSQGNQTG